MRMGKIRTPHFRIVVSDSRAARNSRAIEEIGRYSPSSEPSLIEVTSDRAQYWLSVGAPRQLRQWFQLQKQQKLPKFLKLQLKLLKRQLQKRLQKRQLNNND